MDDKELVEKVVAGEKELFKQIVERYKRAVYKIALRMMGNIEDAKDISQEVFLKIYNNLKNYKPEYKFSSWILKIATNTTLYRLRQKRRSLPSTHSKIVIKSAKRANVMDGPVTNIYKKELSKVVKEALERIPGKYKAVIILRHLEYKSYDEIAEIMDIPLNTVKTYLFRARKALYKELKKRGFEERI